MINMVILCGRLGKDPEIRTTNSGDRVASFSLATTETWRDKQSGERKEKTEWHNVAIWNDALVKVVEQYVKKGSLVHVTGQLQTRKWQDQNGNDRYTTEVVLKFDGKLKLMPSGERNGEGGGGGGQSRNDSGGGNNSGRSQSQSRNFSQDLDDDIPF